MLVPRRTNLPLLILLFLTGHCMADEGVFGPPEMIIDAKIDDESPRGEKRLTGTIMQWAEIRQN
jgi:hypothetical protein